MINDPHLTRIENLYDAVAREYAKAFSADHERKPMDREFLQRFADEIGDRRPVWDFGCGPGQTARYLTDLGLEVSGLDLSERLLEQARTLHPEISFQRGNILALGFEDNSIAGVVAFYAFVHFNEEQLTLALREIFRVLQPGGLFLFTYHVGAGPLHLESFLDREVDIDVMFYRTDFVVPCLKSIGYEKVEIIERNPYPEVEYPSRRAYGLARKPAARGALLTAAAPQAGP